MEESGRFCLQTGIAVNIMCIFVVVMTGKTGVAFVDVSQRYPDCLDINLRMVIASDSHECVRYGMVY